jgi:glycosyltransferase involved in cell wall biosynthesis
VFLRPLRSLFSPRQRSRKVDLWHVTNQHSKFAPPDAQTPVLLTIHDLSSLQESDGPRAARQLSKLQAKVDRAAAVTTISQFVAGEIRAHLNLRGKPLKVIYHGGPSSVQQTARRPAYLPQGPFLFAIGEIVPRKNFHVLLHMMQRVPGRTLVIAGDPKHPYARQIADQVRELGLAQRVFMPGMISENECRWLYQHCEAFVFPSKNEGFGLPVIEAMSHGRPVFLSHSTSLPEVGGPLAFYWQQYDPDYMAAVFQDGMAVYYGDPDYPHRLRQHAAQFTWQRAARAYVETYRDLLGAVRVRRAG